MASFVISLKQKTNGRRGSCRSPTTDCQFQSVNASQCPKVSSPSTDKSTCQTIPVYLLISQSTCQSPRPHFKQTQFTCQPPMVLVKPFQFTCQPPKPYVKLSNMWSDSEPEYDVDDPGQLSDFADTASIVTHLSTDEIQDDLLFEVSEFEDSTDDEEWQRVVDNDRGPLPIPFTATPGPHHIPPDTSPDYFHQITSTWFFYSTLIDGFVEDTNRYSNQYIDAKEEYLATPTITYPPMVLPSDFSRGQVYATLATTCDLTTSHQERATTATGTVKRNRVGLPDALQGSTIPARYCAGQSPRSWSQQDVVFKKADANIEQTQAKQQADFAKRRYKQNNFIVGDKVLRYNLHRADRKGGKQTDPWDGPYEVAQVGEKGLINASTKVTLKTKVNGCNLKPFLEYIPEAPSVTPSPDVQIVRVKQEEISYKFSPLMVAIQRAICNNSGERLVFKKKSRKIIKTFKNTSELHTVKEIEGDGNCLFRALSFAITGEEDQHAVVRSLICDFIACTENIQAESMRNDKVWGTTTEILAAANMFNVNVCVWVKYGPKLTWHIHRSNGEEVVEESVYYLENKAGTHFNVVIRL
ncbi:hypothetical protein Pmani_003184 [Petrolisthes manimaculis]|uniref:OTU domain-containing protein n=1 Tax=Petrolisthes manimaculis TaxID=1843537 RepID=A0AAE1QH55_9EUCA|nr:hypothetical protein Pmani_003184 [Petrolisthes manimaculis]